MVDDAAAHPLAHAAAASRGALGRVRRDRAAPYRERCPALNQDSAAADAAARAVAMLDGQAYQRHLGSVAAVADGDHRMAGRKPRAGSTRAPTIEDGGMRRIERLDG